MRLRKRGFYHYESWRLATYLALDGGTTGVRVESVHQAEEKDSVSISFDPLHRSSPGDPS